MALEDLSYPVDEMIYDLANLRAGHRFRAYANTESRLALLCREAFGFTNCPGYLKNGLPCEYGEGATEALQNRKEILLAMDQFSEDLSVGDLERVSIEWKSLLSLIVQAPELDCDRWQSLQDAARLLVGGNADIEELPVLPELPVRQRERFQNVYGTRSV